MGAAVRIHKAGGPEVLTWDEVSLGSPAAGQVHVKHTAVGLNFSDIYHRTGLYPLPLWVLFPIFLAATFAAAFAMMLLVDGPVLAFIRAAQQRFVRREPALA